LFLTACASASLDKIETGSPHQLSEADLTAIKAGLQAVLKDPESMRLGAVHAARSSKGLVACGWVNAKNSFGGYTGDQPFMGAFASSGTFAVIDMGSDRPRVNAIIAICNKAGITL